MNPINYLGIKKLEQNSSSSSDDDSSDSESIKGVGEQPFFDKVLGFID